MIPTHLLEESTPIPVIPELISPDFRPECVKPMGTICVGNDLHQLVSGGEAGDLIKANHAWCMGECEGYDPTGYPHSDFVVPPKPKPIVTKAEAVAVCAFVTLLMMLFG